MRVTLQWCWAPEAQPDAGQQAVAPRLCDKGMPSPALCSLVSLELFFFFSNFQQKAKVNARCKGYGTLFRAQYMPSLLSPGHSEAPEPPSCTTEPAYWAQARRPRPQVRDGGSRPPVWASGVLTQPLLGETPRPRLQDELHSSNEERQTGKVLLFFF